MPTYMGASEARALVGRFHVGSDVSIPQWQGFHPRPQYAQPYAQPQYAPQAAVHQFREPTRQEWESRPRAHPWHVREHRRRAWESMGTGVPFCGAEALAEAAGGGGYPLIGPARGAISGYPGSGALAHGPYGDPHGARGGHHLGGHRHHQATGYRVGNAIVDAGLEYGISPRAALVPSPEPTMANRQVLPMNTGGQNVGIGLTAIITSRPQRVAFRPERVFVSATGTSSQGAAAWLVNDITIGNRSQYVQQGALPGDMFATGAIDSFITFETAQTAMDVTMSVTFNDATVEGGQPFYGSLIGTAAM
jgi:hypothetical protein